MATIECPHCHTRFELKSSDYQEILSQVRTSEFEREIHERGKLMESEKEAALAEARASAKATLQREISQRDLEIARLKADAEGRHRQEEAALAEARASAKATLQREISQRDLEIARLKADAEGRHRQEEGERALAVSEATGQLRERMAALEGEVKRGKSERDALEAQYRERLSSAQKATDELIRHKDEEIESLRDYRTRLSTKMVGESLEQHCAQEFDRWRSLNPEAFRNVSFEKDNEALGGTKGDFIYRERDDDGTELVSIMFEMKNEELSSTNKRTNESHLAKLDQDRRKKGCEYAVLVSMLELDSELYNQGIVDMSYRHEKMYVIRPQFFLVIITLLRNAALKSLDYRRQIDKIRREQIDITHFEGALSDFQDKFGRNVELANRKFVTAIDEIDKTIQHLQKVKDNLLSSQNNLRLADDKAQKLTIRRLTKNSPMLAERFKELEDESKR